MDPERSTASSKDAWSSKVDTKQQLYYRHQKPYAGKCSNENVFSLIADIQHQLYEMDRRMKRMEERQKKISTTIEKNYKQITEYVNQKLDSQRTETIEFIQDQIESERTQVKELTKSPITIAPKCSSCNDFGHIEKKCPHVGTGLRVCFECKQLTNHMATQCLHRVAEDECQKNNQRYDKQVFNDNKQFQESENRGTKRKSESQYNEVNDINSETEHSRNKIVVETTRLKKNEMNVKSREEIRRENKYENEIEIEKEENKINSDFENTVLDRKIYDTSEIEIFEKKESNTECTVNTAPQSELSTYSRAMLWHAKLGHASLNCLKTLQKKYSHVKDFNEVFFDDSSFECEVCIISKINRLPLKQIRSRASEPLQIVYSNTIGMISPATYPKRYKYISVFIDDYSRLAMAYPMKAKDETAFCFESFIKSARNLLGRDAKVCYLQSGQGAEFTGEQMTKVLKDLGAELQLACPNTPQNNDVTERFIQTVQKKVRTLMYDSGLPENMWDLAVRAAIYAYNRTPHASLNMNIPLQVFKPEYKSDLTQIKRFGCLGYVKIPRKTGPKSKTIGKRVILVGYKTTGFIFFSPEEGRLYESRDVRFNEKQVFADKYKCKELEHWEKVENEINTDTWFTEFEKEI